MITLIDKKKFVKMNKMRRRVAIAKDVIARVDARLIIPHRGAMFTDDTKWNMRASKTAQEFLNSKPCHVCAKGAFVCSWVGNFNHYDANDIRMFKFDMKGEKPYPKELLDIFGLDQLSIIEREFEQCQYSWSTVKYPSFSPNADSPYYKNIKAIMENIVKNKGTFIP